MMHVPVSPDSRAAYHEESSLGVYLRALWRARWLLMAGPALAGIVAYFVAANLAPRYEATVTLMVSPPKAGEQVAGAADSRNFRGFLENRSLAQDVIKELGLDRAPYELTPQRFLDRHISVSQVRGTDLIALDVTMNDPQLAAKVANAVAGRAVALSRAIEQSEAVSARDVIKGQLDAARDRLTQTRTALETYQRQAQVELLGKRMEVLMEQQADLQQLVVDIQGERAYLQQAERDLAQQEPVRSVQRSVQVTPPAPRPTPPPEDRRTESNDDRDKEKKGEDEKTERERREPPPPAPAPRPRPGLRDDLIDPYINPAYETLQQDVSAARSRLAQLEHKRDEMLKARTRDGQIPELAEYYKRKAVEDELRLQQEMAEKIYVDVATRYEQARLQVASRSAQLQIVDGALTPDRRVFPREKLISSAAVVLTLSVMSGVIVLLTAAARRMRVDAGDTA